MGTHYKWSLRNDCIFRMLEWVEIFGTECFWWLTLLIRALSMVNAVIVRAKACQWMNSFSEYKLLLKFTVQIDLNFGRRIQCYWMAISQIQRLIQKERQLLGFVHASWVVASNTLRNKNRNDGSRSKTSKPEDDSSGWNLFLQPIRIPSVGIKPSFWKNLHKTYGARWKNSYRMPFPLEELSNKPSMLMIAYWTDLQEALAIGTPKQFTGSKNKLRREP